MQWSRTQFFNIQKFQFNILKISLQSYKYLRDEKYFLEKMPYVIFIGYWYRHYRYRYRPIRKLTLSGFISIGRYEKKLIGRTLICLVNPQYGSWVFHYIAKFTTILRFVISRFEVQKQNWGNCSFKICPLP